MMPLATWDEHSQTDTYICPSIPADVGYTCMSSSWSQSGEKIWWSQSSYHFLKIRATYPFSLKNRSSYLDPQLHLSTCKIWQRRLCARHSRDVVVTAHDRRPPHAHKHDAATRRSPVVHAYCLQKQQTRCILGSFPFLFSTLSFFKVLNRPYFFGKRNFSSRFNSFHMHCDEVAL
jgi:hypothetical protein